MHIKQAEIFGIVGNTGAGKSTILRLINGFIEADQGEVVIMGQRLNKTSKKNLVKDMAVIFQNYNLLNNLNVIENISLPMKLRGYKKDIINKKAKSIIDYVGLAGFSSESILNLSGGQKQRVAIARSLITNPKILLCDEPTSALDQKMSIEILNLLKNINEKYGTTIVIISHDIEVIKYTCNKVAILENGKINDILNNKQQILKPLSYKERLLHD